MFLVVLDRYCSLFLPPGAVGWSVIVVFLGQTCFLMQKLLRPNKKISVFLVTGLKILGRLGTHIFLIIFFLEKIEFYAF